MRAIRRSFRCGGFTYAELLMAMMVTIIILTAVVTLASAFGNAHDATRQMSEDQTILRTATIRVLDAIRFSNQVIDSQSFGSWELLVAGEINVWRRMLYKIQLWSDFDGNGHVVETEKSSILFYESWTDYNNNGTPNAGETNIYLVVSNSSGAVTVIPSCSNPQISVDAAVPNTKRICISFDLREDGQTRHYEIAGSLWASSAHVH